MFIVLPPLRRELLTLRESGVLDVVLLVNDVEMVVGHFAHQ